MKRWTALAVKVLVLAALVTVPILASAAKKDLTPAEKRAKVDRTTNATLVKLLRNKDARVLYDKSYGYAAFNTTKVSFGLSGGGGVGEAVVRSTGHKTYMDMALGGAGLSIGVQEYEVIFLFQTKEVFDNFVEKGFEGGAGASVAAGEKGEHAAAAFRNGMAVYMFTKKGLVASADITGTRFWKNKDLNP